MEMRGLKKGTIVYETYEILAVLGIGGFGITYQAVNCVTEQIVALKEYFPLSLATRQREAENLLVAQNDMPDYINGKERFMREAAILKEYRYLQGVVRVFDCFEYNETAYIVMEYIDGITLKEYIASHGTMSYWECVELLEPMMKSMISLHKHRVIHRDISPDNMMIGLDNKLYLIDFGAAKEVEYGKTTTVLLKAGYAPPEQYLHDGDLGAWTDVYAICGTMYTLLCGKVPTDAVARLQGKELVPLSEYGVDLEKWQWNAIEKGMNIRAAMRYRDVELLYDALTVAPSNEDVLTVVGNSVGPDLQDTIHGMTKTRKVFASLKKKLYRNVLYVILLFLLCVAIWFYFGDRWTANILKNATPQETTNHQKDERIDEVETATTQSDGESTLQETLILCQMPNVVGVDENIAKKRIEAVDDKIVVRIEKVPSEDVAVGIVIEQSVKADTQYNMGSIEEIVLTVSAGIQPQQDNNKIDTSVKKEEKRSTNETDVKGDFDIESEEEKMVEFYFE